MILAIPGKNYELKPMNHDLKLHIYPEQVVIYTYLSIWGVLDKLLLTFLVLRAGKCTQKGQIYGFTDAKITISVILSKISI